jgi:hypothetical protein
MSDLKLKYENENGETKQMQVSTGEFFIGRHSENDMSIADSAVSRRHLKIERFGDMFVATDAGSSLGTKINGQKLDAPVTLKNGDKIILGDSFEINVVFGAENFAGFDEQRFEDEAIEESVDEEKNSPEEPTFEKIPASTNSNDGNSIPLKFFFIAPLLGLFVLVLIGGIFLIIRNGGEKEIAQGNDFIYSGNSQQTKKDSPEIENSNETIESGNFSTPANESVNISSGNTENVSNSETIETNSELPVNRTTTNENAGELAKIEINSASFLRRIAQKDPRAALTGKQQQALSSKINQFKNSSALAANLKSARSNASAIQTLAGQKNLKPQFLAAAALAKLGNSSGDVLSSAQQMANILDELSRNVGDEFSDDSLLVIAAYEQGAAGQNLEMRNMLQGLTDKFPESSRRIRTIWFLKENGKISDSQFEFALRFLAVGTISQNPRDFGVNAEAVKF